MATIKQLRKNYNSPTPKKLKVIADFVLVLTAAISGSVMGLPISDNAKLWINFTVNIIAVAFKFITKFMTDETQETSFLNNPDIPS